MLESHVLVVVPVGLFMGYRAHDGRMEDIAQDNHRTRYVALDNSLPMGYSTMNDGVNLYSISHVLVFMPEYNSNPHYNFQKEFHGELVISVLCT